MKREDKKHLSLKSLIAIIVLAVLFFAAVSVNFVVRENIKKSVDETLAAYKMLGVDVKYELPLFITMNYASSGYLTVNNIDVKFPNGENMKVGKLLVKNYDFKNLDLDMKFKRLELPLSAYDLETAPPMIRSYLGAFEKAGINLDGMLVSDIDVDLKYSENNLNFDLLFDVDKLVKIDLKGLIKDVDLSDFNRINNLPRNTEGEKIRYMLEVQNAISSLSLDSLNLNLENNGLADGIIDFSAEQRGINREDMRDIIIAELENYGNTIRKMSGDEKIALIFDELVLFFSKKEV